MNLAKEINEKLDQILFIRHEANRMDHDLDDNQILSNIQTGEKQNKQQALEIVEGMIDEVKNELNQITNNGLNVKNIFTNKYYINDFMQDKICAEIETNNVLNNNQPNNIELN
jgi:hypothetical protein